MDEKRQKLVTLIVDPVTDQRIIETAYEILISGNIDTGKSGYCSEADIRTYAGSISRSTLWQWRKRGLKSHQVGGRRLYRTADIDRFIAREVTNE